MTGRFPAIDAYAFLSDSHTAALVAPDGAVEWFCVPHFDGDGVFARLLDRRAGGVFALTVHGDPEPERRYLPETLVLESRYTPPGGVAVGHDFLAVEPDGPATMVRAGMLVRRLAVLRGTVTVTVLVDPRPDYGRRATGWHRVDGGWQVDGVPLRLAGDLPFEPDASALRAHATLTEGQTVAVAVGYGGVTPDCSRTEELMADTCRGWRDWSRRSDYTGLGHAEVRHSALVLRGLAFDETGALLAAPTTSLPEELGGVRNWDYRYIWHRDAALLLLALFRLGHGEEGRRYLRFLLGVCARTSAAGLAPLTSIRGASSQERVLPHLDGYAGARPVRIGNAAAGQVQLDTYGHVLDAALVYQQLTGELTGEQWAVLCRQVDTMADRWREPDHGVWEIRGPRRHYVNSKVLAWVCLDRGIRLAALLDDPTAPVARWRRARAEVHADVLDRGYDEDVGSFVLAYGSTALDASLLRVPLVGFLPGDDPRVVSTIDQIQRRLAVGPGLLRRYDVDDGLPGQEGAFLLCSFELVSALVLAGRREEAGRLFTRLCRLAGPLGLYAEQLAADGTALGNYPQAFSHLALIEAAMNLDGAADRDALHAWAERGAPVDRR